jgi:ferritin
MKLYRHIIDRGNRVQLAPIAAVKTTWKSPKAVFEEVLEHEKEVTGIIHNEVNQTNAEKDHATSIMLQEFVSEQVEEEANVGRIVQTFKMIGDSAQGLIMLDRELGSRK